MSNKKRYHNQNVKPYDKVSSQSAGLILAESFQGPLPPPNVLAAYKEIDPKLPLLLVEIAMKEQEHRQFIDRKKVEVVEQKFESQAVAQRQDFEFGKRGQWLAFVLAIIFLAVVVFLGYLRLETAISCAFGAGGFVVVFSFLAPRFFTNPKDKKNAV
jgi:uncharacterized membrane protein